MRRVLVIGCGGSGKTTLARQLAAKLGLPVVHLDKEFWRAGWVEPPAEEWEERVRRLAAADAWIMDGNYGGTMELRLQRADAVIFLDLATVNCLAPILSRYVRWRGKTRPDLPEGCPETIDLEFVRWVLSYRRTRRAGVLERLARFDGEIVVLRSRRAARRYLQTAK